MSQDEELRKLREAFLLGVAGEFGKPEDPSPERIWQAAAGELSPDEVREVLDQVQESPACAELWIIARRTLDATADAPKEPVHPAASDEAFRVREPAAWRHWAIPMGLAATMLVVIAVALWFQPEAEAPYRSIEPRPTVGTLTGDGAELPRENAVLRWKAGPEGTRYQLRVFRADLRPLFVVEDLLDSEYVLSAEQLVGVADGETIRWQVRALRPGGGAVFSEPRTLRIVGSADAGGDEGIEP